jgi:hypothetical protein
MALPASGEISFANINTELGRASTLTIGLNEAEAGTYGTINTNSSSRPNGTTPNAMDEWYSYNHSAAPAAQAGVDISNTTLGTSITNITIDGAQVTGVSFPVIAGDGASGLTDQVGPSQTIVVSYTNVGGDSVQLIDSVETECIAASGTSRTFIGKVITINDIIFVQLINGGCP